MTDLKAEARRLAEETWGETDVILEALLAFGRLVREEDAKVCHRFAVDQRIHALAARGAFDCEESIRASAKSLE